MRLLSALADFVQKSPELYTSEVEILVGGGRVILIPKSPYGEVLPRAARVKISVEVIE